MVEVVRPPAVAGMFYPGNAKQLRAALQQYLDEADPPYLASLKALIVPHAGYVYSGPVAAFGYKLLKDTKYLKRILIMGPSHRAWFQGIAFADVDAFRTPLGNHPVDRAFIHQLIGKYPQMAAANPPHQAEHCLEVQIPFIQVSCPGTPVVPMLFGGVDPLEIGDILVKELGPDDFLIVSSDLSHYHNNKTAHNLDQQFIDAVLAGQLDAVAQAEACGQAPALALMKVALTQGWQPHLLNYRTSGDIMGDRSQVVGYAAIAYVENGD